MAATAPWVPAALLGWAVLTAAAALTLILTWYSVSGDYTFDQQKRALNLAVATVIVANVACAALMIVGRRAVAHRRRLVLADLPRQRPAEPMAGTAEAGSTALVAGEGLNRYHRAGCQLVHGRDWATAAREIHAKEGRKPCGVCRP